MLKLAQSVGIEIRDLPSEIIQQIKSSPLAQLRTSDYKRYVYVLGDLVFKGPYTNNHWGLINNLNRTYALEIFEDILELEENKRATLKWEYIGCDRNYDNYYLVSRNVGNWQKMVTETKSSKIEEDVKVLQRSTMVSRVSEIEETDKLTNDIKVASLQHLYLRFLLDIGDSGTHNILVRQDSEVGGRLIAGIDLDENRGNSKESGREDGRKTGPLGHLFSKGPSRKQISLYESSVAKIESLKFSQLNEKIKADLNAVAIDLKRLEKNINLWETISAESSRRDVKKPFL
jgi:hypothetical protein